MDVLEENIDAFKGNVNVLKGKIEVFKTHVSKFPAVGALPFSFYAVERPLCAL